MEPNACVSLGQVTGDKKARKGGAGYLSLGDGSFGTWYIGQSDPPLSCIV